MNEKKDIMITSETDSRDDPLEQYRKHVVYGSTFPLEKRVSPSSFTANQSKPTILEKTLDTMIHPATNNPIRVGIVELETTITGVDVDTSYEAIHNAVVSGKYDVIVAPEYSFLPKTGPLTQTQKMQYDEQFKKASEGKKLVLPGTYIWTHERMLYNEATIYYDGEIILRYLKINNGGEDTLAIRHRLIPLFGTCPGILEWEGYRLGIEICADAGVLHNLGEASLDAVFLIASGNGLITHSMKAVPKKGYGILSEGLHKYGEVLVQEDNTIPKNSPFKSVTEYTRYWKLFENQRPKR